jgi:amino acid permease
MVGAGVLQQSMAFEYCGIGSGVALFVVIGYFTYLGANMLARLMQAVTYLWAL